MVLAFVIAAIAIVARYEPSVPPLEPISNVIRNEELMIGGQKVDDPLHAETKYYVAPRSLAGSKENAGRAYGLLRSVDGGKTWIRISRELDFEFLFVHPIDGRLYAIVGHEWNVPDDKGVKRRHFADKAVVSTDAIRWTDITRGPGYVPDLVHIFQDPDHPTRVCLGASVIRYCVIQYTDDDYSDWVWIHGNRWMEQHPVTRPAG